MYVGLSVKVCGDIRALCEVLYRSPQKLYSTVASMVSVAHCGISTFCGSETGFADALGSSYFREMSCEGLNNEWALE